MKIHPARWGKTLKWSSAALVVLAAGMTAGTLFLPAAVPGWAVRITFWIMPVMVLGCLPFMVRSYGITADAILIRRPFWTTRVGLVGLKSAEFLPKAMNRCLRTCGNGGGFSFTGWYWSKSLGSFTAYVTDLNRTVVLRFGNRTVVVSPERPEDFVNEVEEIRNSAAGDRRHAS